MVNKYMNKNLGHILNTHRRMSGLTLQRLGDAAGVSASYIARIERGERYPSAFVLTRLAGVLKINEADLLVLAGYMSTKPVATPDCKSGAAIEAIEIGIRELHNALDAVLSLVKSLHAYTK